MRKMIIAAVALALTGCVPQREAQEAVKQLLYDPYSAHFDTVVPGLNGNVCGLVNAKNRMGGYVGGTPFFYETTYKRAALVHPVEESEFRSLWWALNSKSGFSEQWDKVSLQCRLISQWKGICGSDYPMQPHRLCGPMMESGAGIFQAMKMAYE